MDILKILEEETAKHIGDANGEEALKAASNFGIGFMCGYEYFSKEINKKFLEIKNGDKD